MQRSVFSKYAHIHMYVYTCISGLLMYLWETKMLSVPQNGEIQKYITFFKRWKLHYKKKDSYFILSVKIGLQQQPKNYKLNTTTHISKLLFLHQVLGLDRFTVYITRNLFVFATYDSDSPYFCKKLALSLFSVVSPSHSCTLSWSKLTSYVYARIYFCFPTFYAWTRNKLKMWRKGDARAMYFPTDRSKVERKVRAERACTLIVIECIVFLCCPSLFLPQPTTTTTTIHDVSIFPTVMVCWFLIGDSPALTGLVLLSPSHFALVLFRKLSGEFCLGWAFFSVISLFAFLSKTNTFAPFYWYTVF